MRALILVIVFVIIGYYFYKLKPFNYTPNCRPIINRLASELNDIDFKIKSVISEVDKNKLIERKNEIQKTLSQFFGNEMVS